MHKCQLQTNTNSRDEVAGLRRWTINGAGGFWLEKRLDSENRHVYKSHMTNKSAYVSLNGHSVYIENNSTGSMYNRENASRRN